MSRVFSAIYWCYSVITLIFSKWPCDPVISEIWDSSLEFHITYDLLCGLWKSPVSIVMKVEKIILPTFPTSSTFNFNDRLKWFWYCIFVFSFIRDYFEKCSNLNESNQYSNPQLLKQMHDFDNNKTKQRIAW